MRIIVRPEICTGCRLCELACSMRNEGVFSPSKARIRVLKRFPNIDAPLTCRQCQPAPCADVCPTGAIRKELKGNFWVISSEKCIACGKCVDACPFGAITLDEQTKIATKCDLCKGEPACVDFCLTKAIVLGAPREIAEEKMASLATTMSKSTYELISAISLKERRSLEFW